MANAQLLVKTGVFNELSVLSYLERVFVWGSRRLGVVWMVAVLMWLMVHQCGPMSVCMHICTMCMCVHTYVCIYVLYCTVCTVLWASGILVQCLTHPGLVSIQTVVPSTSKHTIIQLTLPGHLFWGYSHEAQQPIACLVYGNRWKMLALVLAFEAGVRLSPLH
jgi:predicted Rdx family selenoprotein